MLPKSRRLQTGDFKNLPQARIIHAPHLLLRLFPALPITKGKAAVIVSASTYKKAVDRNLLRRRMYHIIGKHQVLLHGRILTVTLKKGALAAAFKELEEEFLTAIKQQAVRRP